MHETVLGNNSVGNIWRWMRITKCKHFTCMQKINQHWALHHISPNLIGVFYGAYTSDWINLWMSSEGVCQFLVIIQQTKRLQISILQHFYNIYIKKNQLLNGVCPSNSVIQWPQGDWGEDSWFFLSHQDLETDVWGEDIGTWKREDKTYKVYLPPKVLAAFHGDIWESCYLDKLLIISFKQFKI